MRHDGLDIHNNLRIIFAQAFGITIDNALNSWALLANLQSLVYLLLVFRDDEARFSVVDDILDFLSHRILVGRHGHTAERLCRDH